MKYLSALLFLLLAAPMYSQNNGVITGTVENHLTKEAIPFATVAVLESTLGAQTAIDGTFTIANLAPGTYQIRISAVGFQTVTKTDISVTNAKPVEVLVDLQEAALELEGVVITSDYFYQSPVEVSSIRTFSNEEIRRSPGGFEDVVRALSILPGVAQADAGRNDLIVRGGAPSENLYILDNIEIPNINHFGTQGATGGPLSFINLDYVRETSFSTGAFPVLYGDKLSSVLRIDLADGRKDRIGGKATIAATQFGFNLEGPVSDNSSFLFSARRSYLDFIFKAANFAFVPEYYDVLAKYSWDIDQKTNLSYLFISAFDNVRYFNDTPDQRFDNSRILGSDQTQYATGITMRRLYDKGFYSVTLSRVFTDFYTQQNDSLLNPIFRNISREGENKLKIDLIYGVSNSSELNLGLELKYIKTDFDIKLPSFRTSFGEVLPIDSLKTNLDFFKYAVFANWSQSFFDNLLSLNFGGRLDHFDGIDQKLSLSPRFSAAYSLTSELQLNFSTGVYYQAPSYIWLAADMNRNIKPIRVDQYVFGVDYRLREDSQMKLEAYYKDYKDYTASVIRPYLVLANTGAGYSGADDNFSSFGLEPLVSSGSGFARGIEFSIQKKLSEVPLYGIFSLTYNESRFIAVDGIERRGSFDQRWIVNLSGGYQFDENWEMSARFRFATGKPYTPYNSDGTQSVVNYNTGQVPDLHALDLRVDRKWYFDTTTLIVYIDIQNVYGRKNSSFIRWDAREKKEDRESAIGILPSIGVSLAF